LPWQYMTHNIHRTANQWSPNPTLLPSIVTATVTRICSLLVAINLSKCKIKQLVLIH
jgi:hypothetical protein